MASWIDGNCIFRLDSASCTREAACRSSSMLPGQGFLVLIGFGFLLGLERILLSLIPLRAAGQAIPRFPV